MNRVVQLPRFAQSYLGDELFEGLHELLAFAHEMNEGYRDYDRREMARLCILNRDHIPLTELTYDLGKKIYERRKGKNRDSTDECIWRFREFPKELHELLSEAGQSQPGLIQDVFMGLEKFTRSYAVVREFLDLQFGLQQAYTRFVEESLDSDEPIMPLDYVEYGFNQLMNLLLHIRAQLDKHHFGRIDFSLPEHCREVTMSVLQIGETIGIPPIISDRPIIETDELSWSTAIKCVQGLGSHSVFEGKHSQFVLFDSDLSQRVEDDIHVERTQDGFEMNMFRGGPIIGLTLNHSGLAGIVNPDHVAPVAHMMPQRSLNRFFLNTQLQAMYLIQEALEHLTEQVRDHHSGEAQLELPDGFRSIHEEGDSNLVTPDRDIAEVKNDLETHTEIKQKVHMPSLTANKILRSLNRLGCRVIRQTGSHMIVKAPNGQSRPLPQHGKSTIGIGLVTSLLKAFDLDRVAFIEHL